MKDIPDDIPVETREIAINDIYTNGLQMRVKMSEEAIENYTHEYLENPKKMPPIEVIYDPRVGQYYLVDGFHRVEAVSRANRGMTIMANVKYGSYTEAMKAALSSNSKNGVQRTNADRSKAMQTVFDKWDTYFKDIKRTTEDGKPSIRQLMELCGVNFYQAKKFVDNLGVIDSITSGDAQGEETCAFRGNAPTGETTKCGQGVPALRNEPQNAKRTKDATTVTDDHLEERNPNVRRYLEIGRDRFGIEIPERILPCFRSIDPKSYLRLLKQVHKALNNRKKEGDPTFAHICLFAIQHLEATMRDIKFGVPFCVCRMCRGLGCASCSHLGFMTRAQYSMVPNEFRDPSDQRKTT